MKLTIALLFISLTTNAQIYFGGGGGAVINKTGYDLLLHSVVGYTQSNLLIEADLHGSLSGTIAPSFNAGVKYDFSESAGIHLLGGVTNDLDYTVKPVTFKSNLYGSVTARLWVNKVMFQTTYFNKSWYCTIGIIGFKRS